MLTFKQDCDLFKIILALKTKYFFAGAEIAGMHNSVLATFARCTSEYSYASTKQED